jgi:hypothetical protein
VPTFDRKFFVRVAVAGTVLAALALSGCGRKGSLDAPGANAGFVLSAIVKSGQDIRPGAGA